ncbi:hypothetical protein N0V90_009113 [Kalmusia sp. IMI 367209]|nr:hypothetical protein N0V90_009113 [Kalmusia sp. IMI 367209]
MASRSLKSLILCAFIFTTILSVAAQYPTRPRAPGVAFRLMPSYGVASIHLKDGTSVDVAQIQGSQAYQAFMRRPSTSREHVIKKDGAFCRLFSPALDSLPTSELGRYTCKSPDEIAVQALLSSLKNAVESYLGTNICFAALVLDDPGSHRAGVAEEALRAIGLRQVLRSVSAGKAVVREYLRGEYPAFDEDAWVVLALEFSKGWFNVGLYAVGEFGIVDPVEGAVGGPMVMEKRDRLDEQMNALDSTLRQLVVDPPAGVRFPRGIHHVVVYGDRAGSSVLADLLESVLGRELVEQARISETVFAGMEEVARGVHEVMDTVEFEMREGAAFGCRWRSGLYREGHGEL